MSEIKWIKLSADIFDNRKIKQIESMPEGDAIVLIWIKLLCLAGNINDRGAVYLTQDVPYTEVMLSTAFGKPLNTVRMALQVFQQFGMIEVSDGFLYISNWEKYQNIDGMEKIREQNRARQKAWYDRQKALPNVTPNVRLTQPNATDIDKNKKRLEEDKKSISAKPKRPDAEFEVFWTAYPNKKGKQEARKAFDKTTVSVDVLVTAITSQKSSRQWTEDNGRYIPYPATWLNQGRWEDETEVRKTTNYDDYSGGYI